MIIRKLWTWLIARLRPALATLMPRLEARLPLPAAEGDPDAPTFYLPKPGHVWNPLKRHRNIPCPCESGLKAKQCCGQFEALPADVAAKVARALEAQARA